MSDAEDPLARARAARDRGAWSEVYAELSRLHAGEQLDADGLYALSDAAWWLGLIRETIRLCEECHQRYLDEGRPDRGAMVALEVGFHWMMRGEPEIGSGWLSRGRRLLEGRPTTTGHGFLLMMETERRLGAGDVEAALAGARELQALGAELDESSLGCFGLAFEGRIMISAGDVERGFGLLDEAMLPVLAGRVGPAESGNLYCQMISAATDLVDVGRARRWTVVTEKWCDSFDSAVMFAGICRVHRAQLLRLQGDWEAALHAARDACRDLEGLNVEAVAEARYETGETHRLRGDAEAARTSYAQAAALGRTPEPGRALLLLGDGNAEEADASVRRELAEQGDPFRRARLLAAQVEIGCARADVSTAEAAAIELEAIAERYGSPGFLAWADTARAAVLVASGRPAEAVAPLRRALRRYRDMGARPDAARASAQLQQALSAADEPTTPPGGLTVREWEILRAVAEGLSNREVAVRLTISEKTVARHLANVFVKLGVGSRTAAAAWAHHHDAPG